MKILIYSRAFLPSVGGLERFGKTLASWLADNGDEVVVATAVSDHSRFDHGFQVERKPTGGRLARLIGEADLVHVNGLSLRGILGGVLGRRPVVVTHQGHQAICSTGLAWAPNGKCTAAGRGPCSNCPGGGLRGELSVRTHRLGAAMCSNVFVSAYLRRRLCLEGDVLYNPMEVIPKPTIVSDYGDSVLFVGRLVEEKGLHLLLRALSLVPGVALDVAGDGPLRGSWVSLASELGLTSRVRFLGSVDSAALEHLRRRSVVVCVPTLCPEAFGYSAAEAMAQGVPVVATPVGALTELLADGRGFLADDVTPESLAKRLVDAIGDSELRRRTVAQAHAFALDNFSVQSVGSRYRSLYARIAS